MTDDAVHRRELRRLTDALVLRTEEYQDAMRQVAQLQLALKQLKGDQARRLYDFNALLARCQRAEAERDLALEILEHAADEHLLRLWEEAKAAAGLPPRSPEGTVPGATEGEA